MPELLVTIGVCRTWIVRIFFSGNKNTRRKTNKRRSIRAYEVMTAFRLVFFAFIVDPFAETWLRITNDTKYKAWD